MRSMIDDVLEGFAIGAIIALPLVPIILLYHCFAKMFYKIKTIFFTIITLIN